MIYKSMTPFPQTVFFSYRVSMQCIRSSATSSSSSPNSALVMGLWIWHGWICRCKSWVPLVWTPTKAPYSWIHWAGTSSPCSCKALFSLAFACCSILLSYVILGKHKSIGTIITEVGFPMSLYQYAKTWH